MNLVRSRRRVTDHGEVFTPPELVSSMFDLVHAESERIESRFLEPACGSGNFLIPILQRKLSSARLRYGKSGFELRYHSLLALMSVYGIELLADNVLECRQNLLAVFSVSLNLPESDEWHSAATNVLAVNIVHGDALAMTTATTPPKTITFAEWSYIGKGRFHRRDFRFDTMTRMASYGQGDTLFADFGKHEIFTPTRDYGQLTVGAIAEGACND